LRTFLAITTLSTMQRDPASSFSGAFASGVRFERVRESVRQDIWRTLKRGAARIPFAEDLLAAYYCAFDRRTPRRVQVTLIAALAYFVLPFDFVPRFLLLLGLVDDAAVLAAAIRMVSSHIRPEHYDAARAALARARDGEELVRQTGRGR
jgi:uncharacterized membrane protein YkvA (DUF1232 family)